MYKVPCVQTPILQPMNTGYDSFESSDSSDENVHHYPSDNSSYSSSDEDSALPPGSLAGLGHSGESDVELELNNDRNGSDSDINLLEDEDNIIGENQPEDDSSHLSSDTESGQSDHLEHQDGVRVRKPPLWMQSEEWDFS